MHGDGQVVFGERLDAMAGQVNAETDAHSAGRFIAASSLAAAAVRRSR